MKSEKLVAVILAGLLWSLTASFVLFIFWKFVAVVSLCIGYFVAQALPVFQPKELGLAALISLFIALLAVFLLGYAGYVQTEWQAAFWVVVGVQVLAFSAGSSLSTWRRRANART